MSAQPRYMSDCEKRLAKTWYNDDDIAVEEIARRLRRNPSSIWESLGIDETATRGVGRKAALSEKDKDRLVKLTEKMVKKSLRAFKTNKFISPAEKLLSILVRGVVSTAWCNKVL